MTLLRTLTAIALYLAPHAAAQSTPGPFGGTSQILDELSSITGMKVLRPVKQETMTRDKLKTFFEQRIREVTRPEDIVLEEMVLKKFGFVPADFDLKQSTVDLMTEQAAAFYDYRAKKMVLLDGSGDAMQQASLVHELAHALADQHFRLEKFLKNSGPSDDATLARTAVMEGQATWLMSEVLARKMGRSLTDNPEIMELMSKMSAGAGSGFPVFEKAPLYMRESLIFPYTKGMTFQHEVVAKLGKRGFTEVFQRAPNTTREIMHPEVYFDNFKPAEVKTPAPEGSSWKAVADGTLGEFDLSILLQQFAFTELDAAKAWRGGAYRLFEHKKDKRYVLAWAVQFDAEPGAAEFLKGYRKALVKKWKQCTFTEEAAHKLAGQGDDGRFLLLKDGLLVMALEGLP